MEGHTGKFSKRRRPCSFFDVQSPLSRIAELYTEIDTEYLFGEGIKLKHLNEQALWNKMFIGTYDLPDIFQKTVRRYDLLVFLRQL